MNSRQPSGPHTVPIGDGPLAYLITFTTYGTRLHGDERGSVDRNHNDLGTDVLPPERDLQEWERSRMGRSSVVLTDSHRGVVERAVREAGEFRDWTIHALNVRSNHVHAVVGADSAPEPVMNTMKAWATRRLREANLVPVEGRTWTRHGSTRYLWKPDQVEAACCYVCEQQGEDLTT